jgi:hypothetical protein
MQRANYQNSFFGDDRIFHITVPAAPLCFRYPRRVVSLKPAPLLEIFEARAIFQKTFFFVEVRYRVCYLSAPLLR